MQRIWSIVLLLWLWMGFPAALRAQTENLSVTERNALQGFNDTIDRLADDFVIASLIIAEPERILYSVLGHAALRLQCPTYGMDYIFSYESEGVSGKIFRFLINDLKMGMCAVTLDDYLQPYKNAGRGVKEYTLHLPPEVKSELWRMCDERLAEGMNLEYDPVKRGCAISIVHSVEDAINSANRMTGKHYRLDYEPWGEKGKRTIREIFYENAAKGWGLFWCMTIVAGKYVDSPDLPMKEKLISPRELADRWRHASIGGTPLIKGEGFVLAPSETQYGAELLSPLIFAILILILAIISCFIKGPYLDIPLLAAYAVFSLLITYLVLFPSLPNSDWNWLIIPFNILPIIFWHWRRYWAPWYAGLLLLWSIVMIGEFFFGHILVDWPHILLTLAFCLVLLKQWHPSRPTKA